MTTPDNPSTMRETLMEINEQLVEPLLEAVDGYRARCTAHGYSPTVAEEMAATFHMHMVERLFRG